MLKSLEDYEQYFDATLKPRLAVLEAERQRAAMRVWRYLRWGLLCFAAAVVAAMAVSGLRPEWLPYVGWLPGATLILTLFGIPLWRWIRWLVLGRNLARRVKDEVILDAIDFLVPDLAYDKAGFIDEPTVQASRLFDRWQSLKGDDLFTGRSGETDITFSELTLRYARKSGKSTVTEQATGLFLVADFNKHFSGQTLLYPDLETDSVLLQAIGGVVGAVAASAKALGMEQRRQPRLFWLGPPPGLELVRMEDPAFEKVFKVFTDDPVEATYILSSSFMQRLTAFREKAGHGLMLSFKDSKVHVFVPARNGVLFDVNYGDDLDDFATFRRFHDDLALALGVVNDLNLNTRIWSKGAGPA